MLQGASFNEELFLRTTEKETRDEETRKAYARRDVERYYGGLGRVGGWQRGSTIDRVKMLEKMKGEYAAARMRATYRVEELERNKQSNQHEHRIKRA